MSAKYLFSLEIYSKAKSLIEISTVMEVAPSECSHTFGQKRFKEMIWNNTAWKMYIGKFSYAEFDEACLVTECKLNSINNKFKVFKQIDTTAYWSLVIGILSDSISSSIRIPERLVDACANAGMKINISTYQVA